MNKYKVMASGILLSLSSLLLAEEATDHSQHEQHGNTKTGYKIDKSKDGLNTLPVIPNSGKSREAGFDERYFMEPTTVQEKLADLCAKGSRGLIILDRKTWQQCGGTPKDLPDLHDSKEQNKKATHQH